MINRTFLLGGLLLWAALLSGCAPAVEAALTPPPVIATLPTAAQPGQPSPVTPHRAASTPTQTLANLGPAATQTPLASPSSPTDPTTAPAPADPATVPTRSADEAPDWRSLPVLPQLDERALAVIQAGLAQGNNPRAFSKIGDCESRTTWFLGDFDLGPKNYNLGPYESELAPVVDYYQGSFNRLSLAAKPGFTSASVLSVLWNDSKECGKNESPLACEYRLNRPVLAFIMLGTNDASNPKTFEGHMRKIIEFSLSRGVLPVLGTKADNAEGNDAINQTIARLAYQYDLPLWNYWRAAQALPDHGLQSDGLHLTFGPTRFDDPAVLQKAWPVRNLNAMQILKMVMDQTK